jgi:hypothetical protein
MSQRYYADLVFEDEEGETGLAVMGSWQFSGREGAVIAGNAYAPGLNQGTWRENTSENRSQVRLATPDLSARLL